MWKFLQHYHVTLRSYQEKEAKYSVTFDQNRCLQVEVERLKQKLSIQKKTVVEVNDKDQKLISKCESLCAELKREKDEVVQLRNKLQHQEYQAAHMVRKKNNEITHLQEQLKHAISMKLPKLPSMKNMTPLDRETVYKRVICKMECNKQLLLQENLVLREAFYTLHLSLESTAHKYKELLEKYCKYPHAEMLDLTVPEVLSKDFYKLPFKVISSQLDSATQTYLKTLNKVSIQLQIYFENA